MEHVCKSYKVAKRKAGFSEACRSLFRREYDVIDALKDVSFTIGEGEMVGYIGPNGAGKSSTIKILSGILTPDSGSCTVDGRIPWKNRTEHVMSAATGRKKENRESFRFPGILFSQLAVCTHLSEALAAENRTVGLGLEGNLCLATATSAGSSKEFTGATGSVLASVTAGLAALGLVLEAALCVELLLTSGEHELVAALFAH